MSATAFANVYYKRATATPKACWVCYKPTTTVLATANTTDFIYACDTHLTDPTFASQIGESGDAFGPGGANKLGLSAEEIAKVKEEWEERQRLKKEKARAKEKEKDGVNREDGGEKKDEGKGKDKDVRKDSASSSSTPPKITVSAVDGEADADASAIQPPSRFLRHATGGAQEKKADQAAAGARSEIARSTSKCHIVSERERVCKEVYDSARNSTLSW
ncbi:hypothetical protein EW146_g10373 [Bondarzewia mesenterica]|uniref:DUF1742-domain-containing protein n=1 Tax=Bondarzewia mesenterica TaxID=1095465 RepID=A0A4S4KXN5_9AGAM|nr:hypothetical protein EW146_g10373 [Bondarzewia mesenterica]